MEIKCVISSTIKVYEYFIGSLSVLCSIGYAIVDNWIVSVFFAFLGLCLVLVHFMCVYISKRKFVFDEIGIKMYSGERMKKQYKWRELKCVYYESDNLSKKEKKKFERSRIPVNPRISVYSRNSNTLKKLVDIYLLENSSLFGYYTASKKAFLSKMGEWNIYLNSSN